MPEVTNKLYPSNASFCNYYPQVVLTDMAYLSQNVYHTPEDLKVLGRRSARLIQRLVIIKHNQASYACLQSLVPCLQFNDEFNKAPIKQLWLRKEALIYYPSAL